MRFRRLVAEALRYVQQYSVQGVEAAARCCELAGEQLRKVEQSAGLAEGEALGFYPEVNRRHMGLAPPRPVKASGQGARQRGACRLLCFRPAVASSQALWNSQQGWDQQA